MDDLTIKRGLRAMRSGFYPIVRSAVIGAIAIATGATAVSAALKRRPMADIVFVGGRVRTIDRTDSVSSAMAIRHGRIVYVGNDVAVSVWTGPKTRVVRLHGRVLMPGIVDAHMHPLGAGMMLQSCNLDYQPLTVPQLLQRVQQCLDAAPGRRDGLHVMGWYRQYMQPFGAELTRADLDTLKTERPIVIQNRDFHTRLVNGRALLRADITRATPNPVGGVIVHDGKGEPTGILEDSAGTLVDPLLTPPDPVSSARSAMVAMSRSGATTVLDAAADKDTLAPFRAVEREGGLNVRFFAAPVIDVKTAEDPAVAVRYLQAMRSAYDEPIAADRTGMRVRSAKLFVDGVIQAQTAGVFAPYRENAGTTDHPHWVTGRNLGQIYMAGDRLNAVTVAIAAAGFNTHMHAIGDRAVHVALNAIEAARKVRPDGAFRPVIAHDELVAPDDVPRFAGLGAIPIMSFQWAIPGPNTVAGAKEQLGSPRFDHMEPIATLSAAGAAVGYGSDWPVDRLNYWLALRAATTRSATGQYGAIYTGRLNDESGISRRQALRGMTINAAASLGIEKEVGSIETGKFGDLIILDRDPMTVPDDALPDIRVMMTVVAGRIVYEDRALHGAVSRGP